MNEQKKFAVFDIDGTLIRWQLFHAIVHGLGKDGYIPDSTHEAIRAARMNWKTRGSDFKSYEQVLVSAYFAAIRKVTPSDYARVVEEVFTEYKDQTYVYTRDLIKTLRSGLHTTCYFRLPDPDCR
jgi:phosphoserine phosphatase